MKKLFYLSLMTMFILVGCNSSSSSSPDKAFIEYSTYLINGQYEKFVDGFNFDESVAPEKVKEQKDMLASIMKEKVAKEFEKKGGLKKIEVLSTELTEDGNSATLQIKSIFGNEEEEEDEYKMIKVDGKWMMVMDK